LQYIAVLINGGVNGIVVFEWQQRLKPNVTKWFDISNEHKSK